MSQPRAVDYDPFAAGEFARAIQPTGPQSELWIGSLAGGEDANRAFNECLVLNIRGVVSMTAFDKALQALVDRHEALRGIFTLSGSHFLVRTDVRAILNHEDLTAHSPSGKAERYDAIKSREVELCFNLETGPLYRASLIKMGEEDYRFLFSAHHVACDGWSAGVLMIELAALYKSFVETGEATGASLAAPTSFSAYALEEAEFAASQEGDEQVRYWLEHLHGYDASMSLPTDHPRPDERTYASRRIDIEMGAELLQPLRQLGADNGCTLLVTFMSAYYAWLAKCTQQDDLVIGVPAAGQVASGHQSLVGHCVHLLPMRNRVHRSDSFLGHLARTKSSMLDGFDNQQVTFTRLLPQLAIHRERNRIVLVPICVNIDVGLDELNFGDLKVDYETIPRHSESFELFVNAVDLKEKLVLECSYNTDLFEESTIRRWVDEFFRMVQSVTASPRRPLGEVSLAGSADREILSRLNATSKSRAGTPVHQLFEAQARKAPNDIAVVSSGQKVSYGQLDREANRLSHLLIAEGVRVGDCVGVCLGRSERILVALLAVLKAGAAYVPMDPSYPADRLQAMVDDAHVKVILGESELSAALPSSERLVLLDERASEIAQLSSDSAKVHCSKDDRAYVLFTSGSTGRPKGVDVPHRAFENVLQSVVSEPGLGAGDRMLALTTISFDIAGVELFAPLLVGASVIVSSAEQSADPKELMKLIEECRVNYMQATPATWTMLLDNGWRGSETLRLVCTGEAFPPELVDPLLACAGRGVWNMYGPTETTVYSSLKRVVAGESVSIGRPIDNTQFHILDADRTPVAVGSVGELWIGGTGVANGYIGRPELTQERFVDDPFAPGQKMYRSGDLARVNDKGEVDCLGRTDFQVKVRGFRIELREIESAIASFPNIRRSAVTVADLGHGDQRLVSYVTAQPGFDIDTKALLSHLRSKLTPYMIPQHVVLLEEFPTTPNGKIDRKALPLPGKLVAAATNISETAPDSVAKTTGAGSQNEKMARELASIWCELLQVETVDPDAGFFDVGGHSLLAVRMMTRVKEAFAVELPLRIIFKEQTIARIASYLAETLQADDRGQGDVREEGLDRPPEVSPSGGDKSENLKRAGTSKLADSVREDLLHIWQEILQVDAVNDSDDFFEMGGHSMLAVRMMTRVREKMGVELPLRIIFQTGGFGHMVQHLQENALPDERGNESEAIEEVEF